MNSLTKVIEKGKELQKLALDGEDIINYLKENPERLQAHIEKCCKLKEEITEADIPNSYKNEMLGVIDKYLNKLNNPSGNNNPWVYGGIGFVLGIAACVLTKYGLDKMMDKIREDVIKGVQEELRYGR